MKNLKHNYSFVTLSLCSLNIFFTFNAISFQTKQGQLIHTISKKKKLVKSIIDMETCFKSIKLKVYETQNVHKFYTESFFDSQIISGHVFTQKQKIMLIVLQYTI